MIPFGYIDIAVISTLYLFLFVFLFIKNKYRFKILWALIFMSFISYLLFNPFSLLMKFILFFLLFTFLAMGLVVERKFIYILMTSLIGLIYILLNLNLIMLGDVVAKLLYLFIVLILVKDMLYEKISS